jgi:hypothetical protein
MLDKENEITDLSRDAYRRMIEDYESRGHLQWFFGQE